MGRCWKEQYEGPDSFVQFSNSFNITIKIIFNIKHETRTRNKK